MHPQPTPLSPTFQLQKIHQEEETQKEPTYFFSYDEIMHLIDEVESGELENKSTPKELEKVAHFIAFLAKEGQLPEASEETFSLDHDIEELLGGVDSPFDSTFSQKIPEKYVFLAAASQNKEELLLCTSWIKKQWRQTKKFVKKHKKEVIIGAAVVVAATAVVVAVVAPPAAPAVAQVATVTAGAAAKEAVDAANSQGESKRKKHPTPPPPLVDPTAASLPTAQEAPQLKEIMGEKINAFKENLVQEQFFSPPSSPPKQISWQDSGKTLGSLFAHDSFKDIQDKISTSPSLAQEIQRIKAQERFSTPPSSRKDPVDFGHQHIDERFNTNYSHSYKGPDKEASFNTLAYQARGEKALSQGYFPQAVQEFSKAIELGAPTPLPYLERGVAHFRSGQYDQSLKDYRTYVEQIKKTPPPSASDFSVGFAKGLPKGIYDSGKGLFLLVSDLARHPVHTGGQIWEALNTLGHLSPYRAVGGFERDPGS